MDEQWAYFVRVVDDRTGGQQRTHTGGLIMPYSQEYADLSGAWDLLERVAAVGGGEVLHKLSDAFGADLPPVRGNVALG